MPKLSFNREIIFISGAALAYALLISHLLPGAVVAMGDDFGYYKSVIQTIQHHRPWTDEWLEPWAASLCLISAILFKTTGSFLVAIHGVQSLLAGAAFWMVCMLLRERQYTLRMAVAIAALFLTFPTILWKSLEYSSVTIYIPCLLFAIWAADRKKWGWFIMSWSLAVASRQSALTWLIIPAWELFIIMINRGSSTKSWRAPALVVIGGVLFFGFMMLFMNKTHAQLLITDHSFEHMDFWPALKHALSGILAFLIASGLGAFMLRFQGGGNTAKQPRTMLGISLILLTLVALNYFDLRDLVAVEHASFQGAVGWYYTLIILALAILGWFGGRGLFQPKMMVYALGSLALISLRKDHLWDYYLLDIMIFGFFSIQSGPAAPSLATGGVNQTTKRLFKGVTFASMIFIVGFHLGALLQLKQTMDRARSINSMFEHAFREGKLEPSQIYGATFGYIGWHLYPYFITHEGRHDPRIAKFWNYLIYTVDIRTKYLGWLGTVAPFNKEFPAVSSKLIISETHHVWWLFQVRYTLEHNIPLPPMPTFVSLNLKDYHRIPYPLNDQEWRELLQKVEL